MNQLFINTRSIIYFYQWIPEYSPHFPNKNRLNNKLNIIALDCDEFVLRSGSFVNLACFVWSKYPWVRDEMANMIDDILMHFC